MFWDNEPRASAPHARRLERLFAADITLAATCRRRAPAHGNNARLAEAAPASDGGSRSTVASPAVHGS
jgi:hypothetical protein